MKDIFKFIFFVFIVLNMSGCKKKDYYADTLKTWIGREIPIDRLTFCRYDSDSVETDYSKCSYKVFSVSQDSECTECQLRLNEWKDYMLHIDSLSSGKVGFVFYYTMSNSVDVKYFLQKSQFDYPVCIDTTGILSRMGRLPDDIRIQTFVLDKQNKVVAIGNPLLSNKIRKLYDNLFKNN